MTSSAVAQHNEREIGHLAVWTVTSAKPGNGVEALRDGNDDSYWQSDGAQPHLVNIQFQRKVTLSAIAIQLDYKLDESYTPSKIAIRAGTTYADLKEIHLDTLTNPQGWRRIPLKPSPQAEGQLLKAYLVQVAVLLNHQNGAERLIVDAACELTDREHTVHIYTAHHNQQHCFEETLSGGFSVIVAGSWFPRNIAHRAYALCAYIRCILASLWLAWTSWRQGVQYDCVIVDQVSVVVPLLHLLTTSKVLFYCHFPDLLQAQPRSRLHRLYRQPLDWAEQSSTGAADAILVNSQYTRGVFADTFSRLARRGIVPGVLYPAVHIPSALQLAATQRDAVSKLPPALMKFINRLPCFLSINRFERKKNIELAVQALHLLRDKLPGGSSCKLVLAGGYDERLPEARSYFQELVHLIEQLGLRDQVWLMPSFSSEEKGLLLAVCRGVLYTPTNEHFGIVPLEAMAAGRPVVACNSGGPRESVVHGTVGLLCAPTADAFADAMHTLLDEKVARHMGQQARDHVVRKFSRPHFGKALEGHLQDMLSA